MNLLWQLLLLFRGARGTSPIFEVTILGAVHDLSAPVTVRALGITPSVHQLNASAPAVKRLDVTPLVRDLS